MLSPTKEYFPIFNLLQNKFYYLTIFIAFCLKISAQQITLNNLKQIANAYICYDGTTRKFGLQSLDKKTQLLPTEYDDFSETGKYYAHYIKMTKNGVTGVYDILTSQIFIKPNYTTIDIKEFPSAGTQGKYYKVIKNYFITSNYIDKNTRNKGLHDEKGEVLACDYESISLLKSANTDSTAIFVVRKRQGPLLLYDYRHRQFLPHTFSNIEAESGSNREIRYRVLVDRKIGVVDDHFNWVIEPRYKEIFVYDRYRDSRYPAGEKSIYVLKVSDSTWTFTNYSSPKITADQPLYTSIRNYDEYVNVYKGKKLGLVNLEHKQILPCEYVELSPFERSPNLWTAYVGNRYGIVNINNEKLCAFKYTAIQEIKPPYVLLYTNETFKIFNTKTRKTDSRVFTPSGYLSYDESTILSAKLNNKIVLLDSNLVIKKSFDHEPIQDEQSMTMDTDNSIQVDTKGPDYFTTPPEPQKGGGKGDGSGVKIKKATKYTVITQANLQGVVDNESGKEVVKPIYKRIIVKQNASAQGILNFVGYQMDNEFGVIDLKTGKTVFSDEMSALSIKRHGPSQQNLMYFELEYTVNNTIRKAIADTIGVLTKALYDQVASFSDNGTLLTLSYYENGIRYSDMYDLDNKKYIIKKTQVIQNINTMTKLHHFLVVKDSLYGVINQEGRVVIPLKYKHLSFDRSDKLLKSSDKFGIVVSKKNKYAALIIDRNGKTKFTDFYDSIYHGVNDLVIVKKNNKYGLININSSEKVMTIDKQLISILQPRATEIQYFVYAIDKGLHRVYDSQFKLLAENNDSVLYIGNNTFGYLQKSGYKLYNTLTASVSPFSYTFLSPINNNNLFVIRNDSVLSINNNEEILRLWDTKHSSHIISRDTYPSTELLISAFAKSLESDSTATLMQWCKNVAQDLTLYHYFESKKINDKIIHKTGSELKSTDTQKNAEALFSVYVKLYDALHERYNKDFVIEDFRLVRDLDGMSKNALRNRSNNTYQYYYEPVLNFKINNTYYIYKMGFLFNELDKMYVYPNEAVRTN